MKKGVKDNNEFIEYLKYKWYMGLLLLSLTFLYGIFFGLGFLAMLMVDYTYFWKGKKKSGKEKKKISKEDQSDPLN